MIASSFCNKPSRTNLIKLQALRFLEAPMQSILMISYNLGLPFPEGLPFKPPFNSWDEQGEDSLTRTGLLTSQCF